jgi:iron complex transport system permease protein
MKNRANHRLTFLIILASLITLAGLFAIHSGAYAIPAHDIMRWITGALENNQSIFILENIRAPRAVLALLVGAALGMAGAAMQGLFRNPLADPALIGASSGAALAVALVIVTGNYLFPGLSKTAGIYALPIASFIGCWTATYGVYRLAKGTTGISIGALLLAGVAINIACEAVISFLTFSATDEQLRHFTFWRMGSLGAASWALCGTALGCAALGAWLILRCADALNAMTLGEDHARHAGFDVQAITRRLIIGIALLVASAVSSAGMVWFVGLVAPHLLRLVLGAEQRFLMCGAALLGGLLTLLADTFARTIIAPVELPLGIPLALIGTPVFISLLIHARRAGQL